MKLKIAFLAGAAVLCLAQFAEAQNFNSTIVFGDSSLDSGWFTGATSGPHSTGIPTYDASIAAALAAGGNGHFTGPGLNNSQIVAGFFGLSANSAGTPGGTNYAIGGAVDYLVPPGYPGTGNLFPNPLLPGTATQISNYLTSVNGKANPNALYLLNSGANDATAALDVFGPNSAAAKAYLLGEAQILTNSVAQLQADGARYIIVSNYYGNVAAYQNTIVSATWSDFAAAGIKFIPADTLSVIAAVATNRAAYGLPPASSYACIPPAFLTGQTGYGVTCVPTTVPNPNYGYLVSANATQTHLYMDGVHLTQAGQTIIADYYYDLLTAPSQISFLAESAIQTTFGMIYGIQQQIDVSQRQAPAGWNFWVNGDLSYLQMNNSSSGFPNDPGIPISGSLGFDYHWTSGWLVGAAVTGGFLDSTFSTGGGFTQNVGALSLYAAYRSSEWWANLIGSVGWLNFSTNRPVPIGITVQPNNGSTFGTDLSLAGEVGYEFHAGAIAHGPVAGFIVQQAMINGFTESGSYTSLSFGNQLLNSDVSLLGYQANLNWGVWHPFAQVVWDHDFAPLNRVVNASLTTIAAPGYSLPAAVVGRDWATATVGTEFKIAASWTGLASVTAELGQQNVINYGGMLGVNYAFAQQPLAPIVYKN